jgi:hypothetical protein
MFFIKLCADIYRYLAEHSESNKEYVFNKNDPGENIDERPTRPAD